MLSCSGKEHHESWDLISFVTALGLLQNPIKNVIKRNNELQEILPSADRVIEILDADTETDHHGIKAEMQSIISEVRFEHVKFNYEDKNEPAVKDFNLVVKPGEVVALVGKSGSGKTTLVNLIPRFYETSEGSIKVKRSGHKKLFSERIQKRDRNSTSGNFPFQWDDSIKYCLW